MDHTADSNYEAWRIMAVEHGVTKLFEYYVTRIHNRFTNPQRWRDYIAPYCTGSQWFEAI